jgi:hypothetical protein
MAAMKQLRCCSAACIKAAVTKHGVPTEKMDAAAYKEEQEKLVQLALEEYVGDQSSCLLGRGRICWGSEQLLTGKRKNSLCSWPLRKKLGRCLMALVLRAVMLLNLPGCSLRRADTLSIT